MTGHKVYRTIIEAVEKGILKEPFSSNDIIKACPNLVKSTCRTFPRKHRKGNPGMNSELFVMVSKGLFKLIRPYKYGIRF